MAVTLRYQGTSVRFGANLGGTAEVSLSSQCGTEGFFVFRRQLLRSFLAASGEEARESDGRRQAFKNKLHCLHNRNFCALIHKIFTFARRLRDSHFFYHVQYFH